jgi:hypothetical protein
MLIPTATTSSTEEAVLAVALVLVAVVAAVVGRVVLAVMARVRAQALAVELEQALRLVLVALVASQEMALKTVVMTPTIRGIQTIAIGSLV